MLNFSRSPTDAATVACIFWLKSKYVLRRAVSDSAGLSVLLDFMPMSICTEPCVFRLTPPGPNIFSNGPRAKFMSSMSNGFLSGLVNCSALR